jgi:large subunit ribosomal protein L5
VAKKEEGKKEKAKAKAKAKAEGKEKSAKKAKASAFPKGPTPFEERYNKECIKALMDQFKYANVMEVPRLLKIVVNTSLKDALTDVKILETAAQELADITGQRPVLTKARKSIANFKLRAGNKIGARVTLRKKMMYEFLNRLVNVALPRVRDFKGISPKGFDGRGNYTLGLTEQTIFPEINYDKVTKVYGMNISFVTTAKTDEEGMALLKSMGMPFRT